MSVSGKDAMARALMAAVGPLVEIFLELGVTSPEAESLLRSVFIHRACAWLARQNPDRARPSDARISLVTGVHRNFVRHILAEPPRIASSRQKKGSRADRLLGAWHSDPLYLDGSGKPRDLAERGPSPSFQSLAMTYLPGTAPGVVLDELTRAGLVQLLSANRLRVRSRSFRVQGLNLANANDVGCRTQELVETLSYNLHSPESRRFLDSMPAIDVEEDRVAVVREIVARRASNFLARMEHELTLAFGASKRGQRKRKVKVGLTIFAPERFVGK
jgi:hypothetical protein